MFGQIFLWMSATSWPVFPEDRAISVFHFPCERFIEQKSGPHMVQKSWFSTLCPLAAMLSACSSLAFTGSSDRLNWSSQAKAYRARLISSSCSHAVGFPFAMSAACAAILCTTTPSRTSLRSGRPRCSFGVT